MTWPASLVFRGVCGRAKEQGFTLIEMLVVLTIVVLVMAIVPSVFAGISGSRLRAAGDEMIGRLREARGEAMQRGTMTELVLDPVRRVYRLSSESGLHSLPGVVEQVDVAPGGLLGVDRLVRVRFFPDGSATEGRLWLRHGKQSAGISIEWLTGRVHRGG